MIDQDSTQKERLEELLQLMEELTCTLCYESGPESAVEKTKKERFDLIITDYELIGSTGHKVFLQVKKHNPDIPVIILTSQNDIELAVGLMKSGVYDFWVKPVKQDILQRTLRRIADHSQLVREIRLLRNKMQRDFSIDSIIGESPEILQVVDTVGRCSDHLVNVLIRGESGTGKELVAHALHHSSPRGEGPLVVVNIAALSESLIESELFGHVKGAFTGAERDRLGRFEEAHGGTLFIDEIGDVSPAVQIKLLRAIQFRQFQRIGENRNRECDVRVISATSRNLEEMMEEGSFRRDLYYRLNVVTIEVPPLRDRKSDIPLLIKHFMETLQRDKGLPAKEFSHEAMHLMMGYDYPGNVRELQNILEQAAVLSRGSYLTSRDLPAAMQKENQNPQSGVFLEGSYQDQMDRFERILLMQALDSSQGNQSRAAGELEISERRLRYRLDKLDIPSQRQR